MFGFKFFSFTKTETWNGTRTNQDTSGQIIELPNGRFGLFDKDKAMVTSYARERDARRGAIRRGISVN